LSESQKLRTGDRVKVVRGQSKILIGKVGTIKADYGAFVFVVFDEITQISDEFSTRSDTMRRVDLEKEER
jgi:ribosomal protein L24